MANRYETDRIGREYVENQRRGKRNAAAPACFTVRVTSHTREHNIITRTSREHHQNTTYHTDDVIHPSSVNPSPVTNVTHSPIFGPRCLSYPIRIRGISFSSNQNWRGLAKQNHVIQDPIRTGFGGFGVAKEKGSNTIGPLSCPLPKKNTNPRPRRASSPSVQLSRVCGTRILAPPQSTYL